MPDRDAITDVVIEFIRKEIIEIFLVSENHLGGKILLYGYSSSQIFEIQRNWVQNGSGLSPYV